MRIYYRPSWYTYIKFNIKPTLRNEQCSIRTNYRLEKIRLRIKAGGCIVSRQTASYFYIISTWRPRYYALPPFRSRSLLFVEACGIFGHCRSPQIHPPSPSSNDSVSCFLEASHGIHTSEAWLRFPTRHPRYTPLCAGVYPIRAILILIKSAERIVWA